MYVILACWTTTTKQVVKDNDWRRWTGGGCGVNDSKKSLTGRKSVIVRNNRFLLYLLRFFQWPISRGHAFFYARKKEREREREREKKRKRGWIRGWSPMHSRFPSFLLLFFFFFFFSPPPPPPPPFSVILIRLKLRISSGNENYTLSWAFYSFEAIYDYFFVHETHSTNERTGYPNRTVHYERVHARDDYDWC